MPMKPLENREGQGVLFHRQVDGNKPTLTGGVRWQGEELEIAGWEKVSKAGREYISLTIRKPRVAAEDRWQP